MTTAKSTPARDYRRKGFGLGTAIFTPSQLKEVHTRIKQAFGRLGDPTIEILINSLEERLQWAGIAVDNLVPLRAFANRSIVDPQQANPKTLAYPETLAKVEQAILERRTIEIKEPRLGTISVWPLQIVFHNIAWYLAFETTDIRPILTVCRLDRPEFIRSLLQQRSLAAMQDAQDRLHRLCRRSGGILLGDNQQHQQELSVASLSRSQIDALVAKGVMQRVRFRCSKRVYGFILSGNNRYPREQIRLSSPLPDDGLELRSQADLQADASNRDHPYPVELFLPSWTVDSDFDFRRWLFGFGRDLKIEAPKALQEEHQSFGAGIASLYSSAAIDPPSEAEASPDSDLSQRTNQR